MRHWRKSLLAAAVAWTGGTAPDAAANVDNAAFERSWSLCAEATDRVERERGIPEHLLGAISLAESGRWDGINRKTYAWPWTVTTGDRVWMLDSKTEAVARVAALRAEGIANIDVGCMQINLRYHPDAFPTVEDAFDPLTNARYAGAFLSDLYQTARNWLTAAGNYHSNTPEFHNRYKLKVARFWNDERDAGTSTGAPRANAVAAVPASRPAAIDYQRTAQLNAAFRARQAAAAEAEAASGVRTAARPGAVMPLVGDRYALNAQIQRVRKEAERRRNIDDLIKSERVREAAPDINPDLQLWRNLYRSGPTSGPYLSAEN